MAVENDTEKQIRTLFVKASADESDEPVPVAELQLRIRQRIAISDLMKLCTGRFWLVLIAMFGDQKRDPGP